MLAIGDFKQIGSCNWYLAVGKLPELRSVGVLAIDRQSLRYFVSVDFLVRLRV